MESSIDSNKIVRGKAVAIKVFTKSDRSDFEELKKAALCEAELMFKLAGMYGIISQNGLHPILFLFQLFIIYSGNGLEEFVVQVYGYTTGKLAYVLVMMRWHL